MSVSARVWRTGLSDSWSVLRAARLSHDEQADEEVCGALTDGDERYPRPEGELCECKDGWGGINCNGKFALTGHLFS